MRVELRSLLPRVETRNRSLSGSTCSERERRKKHGMYVYLHILSFKFETKVRSNRVLNREEGAEAGKNGDGKGNMQIKAEMIYSI